MASFPPVAPALLFLFLLFLPPFLLLPSSPSPAHSHTHLDASLGAGGAHEAARWVDGQRREGSAMSQHLDERRGHGG